MLPALIAAGMVAGALSAAQQLPPASTGAQAEAADNAYSDLAPAVAQRKSGPRFWFGQPGQPAPRLLLPRQKVVCGMTLILPGAPPDPGIVKPKPDNGIEYTLRRVPPRVCGKDQK